MNFNYNSFDYSQKVFQRKVEKKVEEQEKDTIVEEQTAEEQKPRTMEISEGVLRKTDEMVVSYAKAALQIPENIGEVKPNAVEGNLRDGETLQQLIEDWNAHHTENDFETNLSLINSILDMVRDNDDLRFHWVCVKYQMLHEQGIEMLQNAGDTSNWTQEQYNGFMDEVVAIWNDNCDVQGDLEFFYGINYNQLPDELKMDYIMTELLENTRRITLYGFYNDNPDLAQGLNPNYTPEYNSSNIVSIQYDTNIKLGEITNIWQGPYEQMSNNDKIDFLTGMINVYENGLNDPEGARIWRARRYDVCHQQYIQAQLAYLQDLGNGATYDPNAVPSPNVFDGDYQAVAYLRDHYNELSDVEKLVVDEERMSANIASFLGILISLKNPNCTNADELKALANNRIFMIMNYYMNRALNYPENAGDWPVYNNQFIPKFNEFQDIMTHPEQHGIYYLQAIDSESGNVVAVNGNITTLVSELTDIIDTLRDSGFPYCDELLVCIQGYLAYAGFNSINIITPGEGGNAKPEVADPKKKVAQSTTNLK